MLKRMSVLVLTLLMACGTAYAAAGGDLKIGTTKAGAKVTVDRVITEGKALVTVADAKKKPLIGLGVQDFTVSKGAKKGRVVSVQSVAEVQEVPLNIVMVLDNSYSMDERDAITPLLAGVDKVLNVVRPIDKVQVVVFDSKLTTKVGNRDLHVQTFASSDVNALREFVTKAYTQEKITSKTYLYDGIMTGVNLIANTPADNPRVLIIFTDGEDLNSTVKKADVVKAADAAGKFNAYVIDYMPGAEPNKDLAKFADAHHGKIWKTQSVTDMVPIWEKLALTIDFAYILTYEFTPKPVVMVFPEAALFDFDKAELKPEGKKQINAYREKAKAQLGRADKIKVSGHTDNKGSADYNMKLSQQRAAAVSEYLKSIGVDPGKIEASGEGMSRPIADNRTKEGQAKNRRVEIEIVGVEK